MRGGRFYSISWRLVNQCALNCEKKTINKLNLKSPQKCFYWMRESEWKRYLMANWIFSGSLNLTSSHAALIYHPSNEQVDDWLRKGKKMKYSSTNCQDIFLVHSHMCKTTLRWASCECYTFIWWCEKLFLSS